MQENRRIIPSDSTTRKSFWAALAKIELRHMRALRKLMLSAPDCVALNVLARCSEASARVRVSCFEALQRKRAA